MQLTPIGHVHARGRGFRIDVAPALRGALKGLECFDYAPVRYWLHGLDAPEPRATLRCRAPYTHGPASLGVFATRAPTRPNPLGLTVARLERVDARAGRIELAWIDAADGSPVLDLKPYVPALDRVAHPEPPEWCRHWPGCIEDAADFDWASEIRPVETASG